MPQIKRVSQSQLEPALLGFCRISILEEASSISDNAWTLILPALETNYIKLLSLESHSPKLNDNTFPLYFYLCIPDPTRRNNNTYMHALSIPQF